MLERRALLEEEVDLLVFLFPAPFGSLEVGDAHCKDENYGWDRSKQK